MMRWTTTAAVVIEDLSEYVKTAFAATASESAVMTMAECVEWNKKLAAEYTESALKIKGRIDELTAQVRAHRGPHGFLDKEGAEILIRRRFLYTMYADTVRTAHLLEQYYD